MAEVVMNLWQQSQKPVATREKSIFLMKSSRLSKEFLSIIHTDEES
jgi:hypothetical protein